MAVVVQPLANTAEQVLAGIEAGEQVDIVARDDTGELADTEEQAGIAALDGTEELVGTPADTGDGIVAGVLVGIGAASGEPHCTRLKWVQRCTAAHHRIRNRCFRNSRHPMNR